MPLVLREVPDAHLIIFGEGDLRAPLEKQVKQLSLAKRVLLPGFREDVMSLMKSADLFVMSSVTEGLGSAVLDAMAMGHAVVGTKAGGNAGASAGWLSVATRSKASARVGADLIAASCHRPARVRNETCVNPSNSQRSSRCTTSWYGTRVSPSMRTARFGSFCASACRRSRSCAVETGSRPQ